MSPAWVRSFLLVAALATAPTVALAQGEDAAASSRDEEARSLFEAGRTAFRNGRYEDARAHFERSYELSGRPGLLYNIASANDRLRNDAEALAGFEAYLVQVPDAENRVEVEARIEALRAALDSRTPAPEPEPEVPTVTRGPTVIFTFIAGGLALATGAVAVGTWVLANDQYRSLEQGCLARGGCSREEVSGSGAETSLLLTNVFLVGSLVLAGATAVLLPIELITTTSSGPAARLNIVPGGVAVSGRF